MKKLVYGVGLNDMSGMSSSDKYKIWAKMLCRARSIHESVDEMNKNISDEFKLFSSFHKWCSSQKGYYFYGAMVCENLLDRNNKKFNAETCVVLSSKITYILNYRLDWSIRKLEDGKYFAEAPSTMKGKIYLGNFESHDEALLAYKDSVKNSLSLLILHFRERMDDRTISELENFTP